MRMLKNRRCAQLSREMFFAPEALGADFDAACAAEAFAKRKRSRRR